MGSGMVPEIPTGHFAQPQDIVDWEQELVEDILSFKYDPLGLVRYAYPWNEGELANHSGPRVWQGELLQAIGDHLSNPATRYQPLLIAVASGHGIGKTAEISWIDHWAMSCYDDCRAVITANTDTQLRTKTSPEVQKWFRLAINSHWFEVSATSIKNRDKGDDKSWRTDFIPWSEENTEAFQGLHNEGKIVLVIYDEASGIADRIWEVTEGALTDENTIIIWIAFGNPTKNTGRFRECFGKFKHRWVVRQIDSRKVEGTNKAQLQKWVEDYGEDSDFVRVRVRGEFPRAGSNQFIPSDVVALCRKYKAEGFGALPRILSVDVARYGDDQTVIGYRQGRKAAILSKLRGLDTVQVAQRVIEAIDAADKEGHPFDGVVIDGDGLGAGTIDHLKHQGYDRRLSVFEFHGGAAAYDPEMYFNRRAEVWGMMRDWLKAGAEIPDDPELEADLTAPEYGFSNKQQIQLEKKDDMKKRGLSSPDCGDMLAMTFGVKIAPKTQEVAEEAFYGSEMGEGWMR